ncbi:MAG: DUF2490 domain-containing protein [Candidatus Omnitrophica bacterium]|nr:DUF2490 domain-containing protein [Candidatus Omnitrophota bacterium]
MKRLILVLGSISAIFCFVTSVFASGDNKYYSEFALKHKLNDKFDLFFTPELRFNDDMGNFYYYHVRAGSTFHACKNLDLAIAYRFIQNKVNGKWDNNDVQYIEMLAIPKIKLGGFDVSDANKLERRFYENARDRWVYRNLLTFAYPAKICNFEFTPYISDEVYYDFELNKVNLNWATLGANKKINKYLTLGLYYRAETSRVGSSSKWPTNHILGTNISVNF